MMTKVASIDQIITTKISAGVIAQPSNTYCPPTIVAVRNTTHDIHFHRTLTRAVAQKDRTAMKAAGASSR